MGSFARALVERKQVSVERIWDLILNEGTKALAGVNVTRERVFRQSVAFACGRVLSQGCAQVPFRLYRAKNVNGLRQVMPAVDHDLYDPLTYKPNGWQTSFEFRELAVIHAVYAGNAYAFKNFQRGGYRELILLNPDRVKPIQSPLDYSMSYEVRGDDGTKRTLAADLIWHIRGPGWNGTSGWDTLQVAREALGLSIALEESHSRLHAKGVRPSGTYSVEGELDEQQYKDLKAWLLAENASADNAGMPMILDRSAKWLPTAMSGVDSQHIETRRLQIEEVCRFYGVQPIMVFSSDKATTYASAEQMFIAHVVHTLAPWYKRIEDSANVNLLTKEERAAGYYFKFIAAGLLRGALKDRGDYFAKALGAGGGPAWMTQDEIREMDELNPMGGEASKLPPRSGTPAAQGNED